MVLILRLFPIPLLIIGYLLIEVACLVAIGGRIGVLATIAVIIGTAVLGSILLRVQGFGILARIRAEMDAGRVPSRELAHGGMIMVAGLLLMVPGFVSDALGLLLFVPALRDLAWSTISRRVQIVAGSTGMRRGWRGIEAGPTIELDADDYSRWGEGDAGRIGRKE